MKRKHLKNAMSMTLAVAMLSSTLIGNVANASVIVPDSADVGTGSGTITTENSVTVDASTNNDGIVTTSDGIEISTVKENLTSAVQVKDDGITVEDEDGLKAGSKVKLSVSAGNKSSETAKFKLYFWNYADKLPEDKSTWKDVLKDVPEKLTAEAGTATITDADGNETEAKATFMQDKTDDTVTSSYVLVELPANSTLSMNVDVSNEAAGKVVAVPYLESDSETAYGDAIGIDWEEDGIQVDDSIAIEDTTSSDEEDTGIKVDSETEEDGVTVSVDDEAENDGIEVEADTEKTEDAVTVNDDTVDADLFASQRLVVLADDASVIRTGDTVLGQYDNIYLLEYGSVDETMDAYTYYKDLVTAVEPDAPMDTAAEAENTGITTVDDMTAEDNPIAVLNDTAESAAVVPETSGAVIALIDTGVSESKNVIDRVSLIDDVLEGNGHGNDMLQAIVGQNENANVLSIRTMGNDGRGTVSAIIAGMEYALNQNVNIINLSLASKTNLANSVLKAEIEKAVDAGVTVVGAAGNNNEDVVNYMPGSVDVAMIIGAAKENGVRLHSSNYGDTVDYNVVADSTSEAAAKFSGFLSTGMDVMSVVNVGGLIYQPDYEEIVEPDKPSIDVDDDDVPADEPDDTEWQIGDYPQAGITEYKDEKVYTRDTTYDFVNYNPYDEDVAMVCDTPDVVVNFEKDATAEFTYSCSLNSNPDYKWTLDVIFTMVNDKQMASVYSKDIDKIFPSVVCQERNKGYGGIVPEHVGDTVEGRTFNVLTNTENFDVEGLIQDYNPRTFKVNDVQLNGFDIHTPGSYKVTYEMSYFMYFDYTWFVEDTINVVDSTTLEPGVYLTSKESTLLFTTEDGVNRGYGEFVKANSDETYTLSSVSDEYTAGVVSSDETINASEYCTITDVDAKLKSLQISVPEVDHVVVFSLERPGYAALKVFAGGGWKPPTLSEGQMADLEDFDSYEQELLKMSDDDLDDEYMEVAASGYKTVAHVETTCTATTGTDYQGMGTSWGRAHLSKKRDYIYNWVTKQGYSMNKGDIEDIDISCISGYDYESWPPNINVNCTLDIYAQVNEAKKSFRVRVVVTAIRGPKYQVFKGSDYYSADSDTGWLVIRKRMADSDLADFTNLIGELYTTFTVYTDAACTDIYKVLRINAKEVDPSDGYISYKVKAPADVDKYWVKETYTINGTVYNEEKYGPVSVTKGNPTDVGSVLKDDSKYHNIGKTGWIYNKPYYFNGTILIKKGDDGKKLSGAVFRVQYSEKNFNSFTAKRTWYLKTDENGALKFDNDHYLKTWTDEKGVVHKSGALLQRTNKQYALPVGYLRIKEMQAPKDYDLNGNTFDVRLKATSVTNIKLATYIDGKQESLTVIDPTPGDRWKVQVNLKKVDGDGKGLAGAIFGVWDDENCSDSPLVKLESKDGGMSDIKTITVPWEKTSITLWCKEIQPPSGYTSNDSKYKLTFERTKYEDEVKKDPKYKGELKTFGPKTGIPNDVGWTVRVHAKKVNQSYEGVAGAVFSVYTDASCTNSSKVGELTSDADGNTDVLSVGVSNDKKEITLYAKETGVPKNCTGTNETFHVTFKKADYDELKKKGDSSGELKQFGDEKGIVNTQTTPPPSITPTPTPRIEGPGVHVVKHSTAPDDMMALNSYSLEGATFSVTSSDGFSGTLTTDASGISNTLTLPDNSDKKWVPEQKNEAGEVIQSGYWNIIPKTTIYTIKETTPPKNHKITEKSPKYISVTMPYQKDTTFTVTFDDDIITCKPLELEKLGVKGNPIEGVVYKVEYFDGSDDSDDPVRTWYLTTDKNGKIYMDTSHVSTLPQYHSDPFFTYKGNVVLPVDGYLKATEVQAPAEYVVKDTPVTFTTSENQDMSTMVYNDMERCKVNLKKYDNDGKAIAGVEFELKFVKAAIPLTDRKNQYFSRLLNEGETIVRSTDWEGNCYFDNLDQGDYEITEIKTAMGQTLLKDPIKFTLPFKMSRDEAIDYGENLDLSKAKEDKDYTNKWFFFECTYEITNTPTFHLPETGSTGTWNYGFVGLGIALAAGGCGAVGTIVTKRRRRRKQNN